MSRHCPCRAILANPRLRLLPLAARALLIQLVDVASSWPEAGGLRLGGRALSNREIALLVSAEETEVSNLLENLRETGFVNRAETDGALVLPVSEVSARTGADRGGRPRRGETAEMRRQRLAQGNLILPIAGGAAPAAEKPRETEVSETPASLASSLKKEEASELMALGTELETVAGLDPAKHRYDFRPVAAWLAAGIAASVIRDTISAIAGRPGYRDRGVRSFAYFDQAIRDAARATPPAPPPPPTDPAREAACAAFNHATQRWRDYGMLGQPPRLADFLQPHGAQHAA